MRYFLDTEFAEKPGSIKLISVGIVSEDDRHFYAESSEFTPDDCNEWVKQNVLPKLGQRGHRCPNRLIGEAVRMFVGADTPEFWGYYADYDWVVFCWLFGSMIDLPLGWPMYCRDLKQWADQIGAPKFESPKGEHNALEDAKWNRDFYAHLRTFGATP